MFGAARSTFGPRSPKGGLPPRTATDHSIERTISSAAGRSMPTMSTWTRPGLSSARYARHGVRPGLMHVSGISDVSVNAPTRGPSPIEYGLSQTPTAMRRQDASTHRAYPLAIPSPSPPPHRPKSPNPGGSAVGTWPSSASRILAGSRDGSRVMGKPKQLSASDGAGATSDGGGVAGEQAGPAAQTIARATTETDGGRRTQ